MHVTKVHVRQTRQVRKFEPEHLGLEIELAEGESVMEAINMARATINVAFGEVPDEHEVAEAKRILAATTAATFK